VQAYSSSTHIQGVPLIRRHELYKIAYWRENQKDIRARKNIEMREIPVMLEAIRKLWQLHTACLRIVALDC